MNTETKKEQTRSQREERDRESARGERRDREKGREDRERDRSRERDRKRDRHRDSHRDKDKDQEKDRGGKEKHLSHRPSHRNRHYSNSPRVKDTEGSSSRHKDIDRERDRDRDRRDNNEYRHRHHKHKHSRRENSGSEDEDKKSSSRSHRHKSRRSKSPSEQATEEVGDMDEGQWVEKPMLKSESPIPEKATAKTNILKRDSWMVQSDQDAFDFTQRGVVKKPRSRLAEPTRPDYQPVIHKNELNTQLREGKALDDYQAEDAPSHTFGDAGSNWRMMKLKRVYEIAEQTGRSVEDVALERYGDLKSFDEAREERQELERRQMYGKDRPDAKDKSTGDLYAARLQEAAEKREKERRARGPSPIQGQKVADGPHTTTTQILDQTMLNRMQASVLKAQLRGDPKAAELEKEYNAALAIFSNQKEPEIVVLSAMDSRMLARGIGGRGEVKEITTGKRKGQLEDNDDMTLEDMLREEKRTRGMVRGGEGRMFAERIAKDARFSNDLDYLDENADTLARRVHKNEISLKNIAISDFKKMQKVLDTCPLCSHEDRNAPPIAPIVSLGTRVFLSLPTEPELSPGGAMIVPIQHRLNTLECDDDEWDEIRNFMKSLVRLYHSQGRGVIFYENAASSSRKRHAAITAVPMPKDLVENAPAYFREAIMSTASEWSQHKKILTTRNPQLGKRAFRLTLVKEMPYFHVWFDIDGGIGHIVEDENKWPRGDLFAREVIGGMLDADEIEVIKRQGRWTRGGDSKRVERFRKEWHTWDWTRVLLDNTAERG
ncbi:CwfJ C-terminus 1-domain-containing protein-like protein [Kalaharituber pfeilii]|nr:CwfJ C-terminus 1-domain-containing protein-like protein [Kalaharituber pfeilii]